MNIKPGIESLKQYVDPKKVESMLNSGPSLDREIQRRVLVIILGTGPGKFRTAIADAFESIGLNGNTWIIESLNPVVCLSSLYSPASFRDIQALASLSRKGRTNFRFVAATGKVEYGIIGSGTRMSYGSVSALWTVLIEAAISLPESHSWITEDLIESETEKSLRQEIHEFTFVGLG